MKNASYNCPNGKSRVGKAFEIQVYSAIDYSNWISNMVPVKKSTKKIQIYTDFRDLNKACPKVDFTLPNIDSLVDSTIGHEMLSLMDGFLGYNKINVASEYQHKITFTTPWGILCYKVMPFGLKMVELPIKET